MRRDVAVGLGALAVALAVALGVVVAGGSSTKTVTSTVVRAQTVTQALVAEDRDADKGDASGKPDARSNALGAPHVVRINPAAESGSEKLAAGSSCGVERAAVKHLTDGFKLPSNATVMSVDQLVSMAAPPVGSSSPRFPIEQRLVELRNVHVIAAKQEPDSDLHIIVATATGAEMNVESPMAQCDASSPYAAQLAQARAAIDKAIQGTSTGGYSTENVTATIQGVLFFDVLHGQRGAPNGVELHPVTYFSTGGGPGPTTTTTPTTAPVTTAPTPTPAPATGCKKWPGRHWFHHVYHRDCRPYYFKTKNG